MRLKPAQVKEYGIEIGKELDMDSNWSDMYPTKTTAGKFSAVKGKFSPATVAVPGGLVSCFRSEWKPAKFDVAPLPPKHVAHSWLPLLKGSVGLHIFNHYAESGNDWRAG